VVDFNIDRMSLLPRESHGDNFVALVGDIHGDARPLIAAANIPGVVAVVQLGDFALTPDQLPDLWVPLYWIEGNHELWATIVPFMDVGGIVEIAPWVYYVGRGTVLPLGGLRLLCGGGADSVDRAYQERHAVWSAREQWSASDESKMLAARGIDAILTHSPPQDTIAAHFDPMDLTRYFGLPSTWVSPVAEAVARVRTHHGNPPLYCGHMHRSVTDGATRILDIDEIVLIPCAAGREADP
jgi:hypothetical protein